MIVLDEDALICDLAETYNVLDFRALPLKTAAALACGLRENSRIKCKVRNERYSVDTLLVAAAVDRLSHIIFMLSKNGNSANRPESILKLLLGQKIISENEIFDSVEDFKNRRKTILKGFKNGL